jgi:hypothetical protein
LARCSLIQIGDQRSTQFLPDGAALLDTVAVDRPFDLEQGGDTSDCLKRDRRDRCRGFPLARNAGRLRVKAATIVVPAPESMPHGIINIDGRLVKTEAAANYPAHSGRKVWRGFRQTISSSMPELVIDAGNLAAAARKVRNALAGAPALVYQRAGLANSRSPDAR